jgi:putative phosphoribosyl transferase
MIFQSRPCLGKVWSASSHYRPPLGDSSFACGIDAEVRVSPSEIPIVEWPNNSWASSGLPVCAGITFPDQSCERRHITAESDQDHGPIRISGSQYECKELPLVFRDRAEAGRALAKLLTGYEDQKNVLVLGVPRGGVPVAFEVAAKLHAPLDVFIVRKLGVPGREELAFGAIASGGIRFLDTEIVEAVGISEQIIEKITAAETQELERRERAYREWRSPLTVEGQTVILVDDGIATGSSMQVAMTALRERKASRLVVAVPVAPASTCRRLRSQVDDLICVQMPKSFYAIGEFYEDFSQVSDQEVTDLLRRDTQNPAKDAA